MSQYPVSQQYTPPPNESYLQQLKLAAIFLLIAGAISLPYQIVDFFVRLHRISTGEIPPYISPGMRAGFEAGIRLSLAGNILAFILSAIMVTGAVSMLRRRNFNFALTAAILAVVPATGFCCCILNLPFGIWAMILLLKPEVKAAFS